MMNPEPNMTPVGPLLVREMAWLERTHTRVIRSPMAKPADAIMFPDRMKALLVQLRRHAPHAAEQLVSAQTEREVRDVICQLFDLTSVPTDERAVAFTPENLPLYIAQYIDRNLPKGLTLKTMAQFLGYSEKYCSDFFQSTMGESFSSYLKHRRLERATLLLAATEKSMAEIAAALGFSDQFSFSHFFKRTTGQSPIHFRLQHGRNQRPAPSLLPEGSR